MNAIAPGYIDTDMTQALIPKRFVMEWEKQIPVRRFGIVEDIAEACGSQRKQNTLQDKR